MKDSLNHRWVHNTLLARGLPTPDLKQLERAIKALQPKDMERLRTVVQQMTAGQGETVDMEWVAQWCKAVMQSADSQGDKPGVDAASKRVKAVLNRQAPTHPLERSHHVYGTSAAMCVEVRRVEQDETRGGFWTVVFEFAPRGRTKDEFSWERKTVFRLGLRELDRVAAVFAGDNHQLQLDGHGQSHRKNLSLEDQGSKIFAKVHEGSGGLGVPITAGDFSAVFSRIMYAVAMNAPGQDGLFTLRSLRRVGQMDSLAHQKESEAA